MLIFVLSFCAPAYPVSAGVGTPSPLATPTAVVSTTAGKFLCLSLPICAYVLLDLCSKPVLPSCLLGVSCFCGHPRHLFFHSVVYV